VGEPAITPASSATTPLRSAQTLPVPLGGLTPAHRRATPLQHIARRHHTAPLLALAVMAAASGVWLSTSPRSFEAGHDATGVHMDDMTLTPVTHSTPEMQMFIGAAALAIATTRAGTERAGAVMSWNGVPTTARCVLRRTDAGAAEVCDYHIGATRLSSTDDYAASARTWHRRYSDGMEIAITVPTGAALIPIPFPLGR